MQTFVISSKDLEKGREEALRLASEQKINKFDIDIREFEKDLGIEEVRNLQKNIFLRPGHGQLKAVIMLLQKEATVEAQNSMLKLLEEPPPSCLIYIVIGNHRFLLPTILSRAKVIELANEQTGNADGLSEILKIQTPGDALELAQKISADKNAAIEWLEATILSARELMLEKLGDKQESLRLRKIIHNLEIAHYDLKNTNTNPRLALENLFLNI